MIAYKVNGKMRLDVHPPGAAQTDVKTFLRNGKCFNVSANFTRIWDFMNLLHKHTETRGESSESGGKEQFLVRISPVRS